MDRKTFMRDVYSNYWITAREKIYGFSKYDQCLCDYICKQIPRDEKILEVAIGTGYPFADYFQRNGYSLYGVDISPLLVEKCHSLNPNIQCKVGDAEKLEYPNQYFGLVYCFHSTWYFPNLEKAIDEMLRVTHLGGIVMFDVQNLHNKEVRNSYNTILSQNTFTKTVIRCIKNSLKLVLRRGPIVWGFVVHETPTFSKNICTFLRKKGVKEFFVLAMNADGMFETRNEFDFFEDFPRLVFVIRK